MRESNILVSFGSGPAFVNCLHDFFGPPHCIRDCAHCRRNSFPAIELCQLPRGEDTGRNQQHAFAALVHPGGIIAYSFFVRLIAPGQKNHTCKITCKEPVLAVLQRAGEVPNGV
jgi:hypothetical protein